MKPIRVAVIGRTGRGNYGHGLDTVWLALGDEVEIVAVADEDEKGRAAAAARLKAPAAFADYREMLDKVRPQVVSVAPRRPDCHRDMVIACAEAGAAIFLEKPMARTLEEADEMIAACERKHVHAAIAHQTRYSPRLARVREMIAEGALGRVLELRGRGKEDARVGGEDLMVLGTHVFDLMRQLAGDARWCFADIRRAGRPATGDDVRPGGEEIGPVLGDDIAAMYGFDAGVRGHFATQPAPGGRGERFGLQVFGSKGMITLTTGSLPEAWFCPDPTWSPGRSKAAWREITSAGVGKPEPLKDGGLGQGNVWIVRDLLEAVAKDRRPLGSLYDGRAALEMILAVYQSHRLRGPVGLPLKNRRHPLQTP